MDKQLLKQVIIDQKSQPGPDPLILRSQYAQMLPFLKNPQVIVISGIRRSGKSVLMSMLRKQATEADYCINFDDDRLVQFALEDFDTLLEVFIDLYGVQNTFYFDEIQNIVGWERFVRRLHNNGAKVFVTGSNAKLLSSELGTHLTGRHITVNLYPYSFKEYMFYRDTDLLASSTYTSTQLALIKKYFGEFKQYGGFPEYLANKQKQYLQNLYESILYKDLIVRNKISNPKPMQEMLFYLASNNSKEFTYNSLRKLIGVANANTVSEYFYYIEKSFLCFALARFSYTLKEQIHYAKKSYFIDQALAEAVGFRFSEDSGRVLENIVFLQLKRQGADMYFHKQKHECDFVIRDGYKITTAIQVCASLNNQETRKREIQGLLDAMHMYQTSRGLIITEDEEDILDITHAGANYSILITPAWKWLLQEQFI